MIKIEYVETYGWEAAIRGMRNPMDSHDKSDSFYMYTWNAFSFGKEDLALASKLAKAGGPHAKFRRQIGISMDITAPFYFWKEFDTYKVGTVADSESTMHCIHKKEFTLNNFSTDHLGERALSTLKYLIEDLNDYRESYLDLGDKYYWWQMIESLPMSYNQKRTVTLNYEVAANMYRYRHDHKLDEWHALCEELESLPYAKELIVCE